MDFLSVLLWERLERIAMSNAVGEDAAMQHCRIMGLRYDFGVLLRGLRPFNGTFAALVHLAMPRYNVNEVKHVVLGSTQVYEYIAVVGSVGFYVLELKRYTWLLRHLCSWVKIQQALNNPLVQTYVREMTQAFLEHNHETVYALDGYRGLP